MRTKISSKQILLRSDLHSRLKRLCFDREIQMKELVNLIIRSILDDQNKVEELIAELQGNYQENPKLI